MAIVKVQEDEKGRFILIPLEFAGMEVIITPISKEDLEKYGIQS